MDLMHAALPTSWLVWLLHGILALLAAEAVWLLSRGRWRTPRLGAVLAGASLLLAWRLSLAAAPGAWVALSLGLGGLCHALTWWGLARSARAGAQAPRPPHGHRAG